MPTGVGHGMHMAAPATLAADPSQFNPPRQVPYMGQPVVGQNPSYVPPPAMPVIRNTPSYVPPPAAITMAPPVTYAAPTPDVMSTTTSVAYPAQLFTGTVPMDPSSVQFHQTTMVGMPASTAA